MDEITFMQVVEELELQILDNPPATNREAAEKDAKLDCLLELREMLRRRRLRQFGDRITQLQRQQRIFVNQLAASVRSGDMNAFFALKQRIHGIDAEICEQLRQAHLFAALHGLQLVGCPLDGAYEFLIAGEVA